VLGPTGGAGALDDRALLLAGAVPVLGEPPGGSGDALPVGTDGGSSLCEIGSFARTSLTGGATVDGRTLADATAMQTKSAAATSTPTQAT
jgi:hypothetical protein